jgi:hypothetical protein
VSWVPLMCTVTYMVRVVRGWIPVSTWREMVRSAVVSGKTSLSDSSIALMVNNCLHLPSL